MSEAERCIWCGQTYEDHLIWRAAEDPVPRTPCLGLRKGYRMKPKAVEDDHG